MIYRNNFFSKQIRQPYINHHISIRRKLVFGVLLGLLSFSFHLVLLNVKATIIGEQFPSIVQNTYFATLYTFINTSLVFCLLYYIVFYNYLSFEEIRKNRWYLLVKMSYKPRRLILSKIFAGFASMLFIYTTGFCSALFLPFLLKYTHDFGYVFSLYAIGLIDIFSIIIIGSVISLYISFIKRKSVAKFFIFIYVILLYIIKSATGFQSIITTPEMMNGNAFSVLFDINSTLFYSSYVVFLICTFIICYFKAKKVSDYYTVSDIKNVLLIDKDIRIAKYDNRLNRFTIIKNDTGSKKHGRFFDALAITSVSIILFTALLFNAFFFVLSSQPSKKTIFFGIMPYVADSETMNPLIMKNDLVFFEEAEPEQNINSGKIVLFNQNNNIYVRRIIGIDNDKYITDADNYPNGVKEGTYIKTVNRNEIYGIYMYRNRLFGAIILLFNNLPARILFVLIPFITLIFIKPIRTYICKKTMLSVDITE